MPHYTQAANVLLVLRVVWETIQRENDMTRHNDTITPADRRADQWAFLKAWARRGTDGATTGERPAPRRKLTAARADLPAD
jgi:hypothetical protein